ncbi:hypothetical protein DEA98_24180 [Brucella pseudogrignonensis]|nr:hypothetical protein [Brucella pseudogrignonensis]
MRPRHAAFMRQFGGINGVIDGAPLSNAWRPHDTLTLQVLDAMVRRVNAVQKGPVSGRPFDFAISTGDNADTRATHELQAVVTTLNGGLTSMSATDAPYVGIQDNAVVSKKPMMPIGIRNQAPVHKPMISGKSLWLPGD